jgi:hypothetical protein
MNCEGNSLVFTTNEHIETLKNKEVASIASGNIRNKYSMRVHIYIVALQGERSHFCPVEYFCLKWREWQAWANLK